MPILAVGDFLESLQQRNLLESGQLEVSMDA